MQIRRLGLYVSTSLSNLASINPSFISAVSEAYMIGDVEVSSLKGAMNVRAAHFFHMRSHLILSLLALARQSERNGRDAFIDGRQSVIGNFRLL
jgi:hypothetical protein